MRFDKSTKLFPIVDFAGWLTLLSPLGFNITRFSLVLKPEVNRMATNVEQLAWMTFRRC